MAVSMHPVKSSMIKAIGHDASTNTLHVEFPSGKTYRYKDVPQDAFHALKSAESIGKHFGQNIRGAYKIL